MEKETLQDLIRKYLAGKATEEEKKIIARWYDSFSGEELSVDIPATDGESEELLHEKMLQRLKDDTLIPGRSRKKAIVRKLYLRWAVAAAAVVCFVAGAFYLFNDKNAVSETADVVPPAKPLQPEDITPGGNKAILQLADGRTIELDTAGTGLLAYEGSTQINLLNDGQVAYQSSGENNAPVSYNTLLTPAGGQYSLTLSDGTRVWLNAISSIHFPTSFTGKERVVQITGEAYFEVAPDKSKPFKVQYGSAEVTVLGTHFNVNAYPDEKDSRVTLVEGSVIVKQGNQMRQLKPGQQAIGGGSSLNVSTEVNVEEVVAWKNGYFEFSSTDIETMMRQAARWYNIEVAYQGEKPNDRFTGRLPRNVNLAEFLKILKYSDVKFRMEDRKIIL